MPGDSDGYDLALATASILADKGDVRVLLDALVRQLSGAFGDRLRVQRRGGLLRKSDEVRSIEVTLGSDVFRTELRGDGLTSTVGHLSGGIRIRSETLTMPEWLERLLRGLQAEAGQNQAARMALENIVMGGTA